MLGAPAPPPPPPAPKARSGKSKSAGEPALASVSAVEAPFSGSATRATQLTTVCTLIGDMLRGGWDGGDVENRYFYGAAQAGVDAIFALSPRPELVVEGVLRDMLAASLAGTSGGMPPSSSPTRPAPGWHACFLWRAGSR